MTTATRSVMATPTRIGLVLVAGLCFLSLLASASGTKPNPELQAALQAADAAAQTLADAETQRADCVKALAAARARLQNLQTQYAAAKDAAAKTPGRTMDPLVEASVAALRTQLEAEIPVNEVRLREAEARIRAVKPEAERLRANADALLETAVPAAKAGQGQAAAQSTPSTAAVPVAPAADAVVTAAQKQMADFQAQMDQMKARMEQALRETEKALEASRSQARALEQEVAGLRTKPVVVETSTPGPAVSAPAATAPAEALAASAASAAPAAAPDAARSDAVQWAPAPPPREPVTLLGGEKIQVPGATGAPAQPEAEQKLQFFGTMLSGDKEMVEPLDAWKKWADHITFNPVTLTEINEFRVKLTQALQQDGYVFAKVRFPPQVWAHGIFLAQIDCGPLGSVTVAGNRYYSAQQLIRAISHRDNDRFDYARIHRDLFDLTSRPDLKVDTKLKTVVRDGRTVIDADLMVKDTMPIHGAVELTNTATKPETGEWRLRTTLQHLNLTKHDDALTLGWLTNPQATDEVNVMSGSYTLPFWDVNNIGLFGGYSESDIKDVAPELDVSGRGYFGGLSLGRVLHRTKTYDVDATVGWTYQETQSAVDLATLDYQDTKIDLSLFKFSLGYSDREFDRFMGRNFASYSKMFNSSGRFGSSSQDDFTESRADSDATFTVDKLQFARFQKLAPTPGSWLGRSTLFLRLDSQYSSDNLIGAVQMPMGGVNSVRGYAESEVQGESGVIGSLELRLPLWGNFIPGLVRSPDEMNQGIGNWKYHGLQFVLFVDAGRVQRNGDMAGSDRYVDMNSGGFGFRFACTEFTQIKLDMGFPFTETEESSHSGRAHLSLKLLF